MISEKDRSQLLRMAGNVACGVVMSLASDGMDNAKIAVVSADIAYKTLLAVDRLIALNNSPSNAQQDNQPDSTQ